MAKLQTNCRQFSLAVVVYVYKLLKIVHRDPVLGTTVPADEKLGGQAKNAKKTIAGPLARGFRK